MKTCSRCGAALEARVSKRGRTYFVDAATRQYHAPICPGRKRDETGETSMAKQIERMAETSDNGKAESLIRSIETERERKAEEHAMQTLQTDSNGLAAVIAAHVAAFMPKQTATVDESKVRAIVAEAIGQSGALRVEVTARDGTVRDAGRQHKRFPLLLQWIACRKNVWMVGPAGSGKTSAACAAAKALDLQFGSMSVGPQTTQSAIFGYMDAHGNYVETEFRRRYRDGGVFLFDEIDRGNPGVLTALNQAIENGKCAFPDDMVDKHPDFVAIAAANTFGTGADRLYVGALQLDAATLDRFVQIAWDYDESLETDLAHATYKAMGGTDDVALGAWLAKVRNARNKAATLKLRVVVSPRASIVGAAGLAAGIAESEVAACVLWKGMDADTIARLT